MKFVVIQPVGRWWVVKARCDCGCGRVVRSCLGATLLSAVQRFRFHRGESWRAEEATVG